MQTESIRTQYQDYREYLWKALQVFTIYRLLLSITLLILLETGLTPKTLGAQHTSLYQWATLSYFVLSLLTVPLVTCRGDWYLCNSHRQLQSICASCGSYPLAFCRNLLFQYSRSAHS